VVANRSANEQENTAHCLLALAVSTAYTQQLKNEPNNPNKEGLPCPGKTEG